MVAPPTVAVTDPLFSVRVTTAGSPAMVAPNSPRLTVTMSGTTPLTTVVVVVEEVVPPSPSPPAIVVDVFDDPEPDDFPGPPTMVV